MNNIYVDELPKDCSECKLGYFYDCQYCFFRPDLVEKREWCEKEKHCQLKSLSDRLAEERKKVVQEIRERLTKYTLTNDDFLFDTYYKAVDVEKVLDQIERGEDE